MKKLSDIKITKKMLEEVSTCATPEALICLAREYDVEISPAEAENFFARDMCRKLSENELDLVIGGMLEDPSDGGEEAEDIEDNFK